MSSVSLKSSSKDRDDELGESGAVATEKTKLLRNSGVQSVKVIVIQNQLSRKFVI